MFHYTKDLVTLKLILEGGFKPSFSPEKLGLFEFKDKESYDNLGVETNWLTESTLSDELKILMVCFCDIPIELSSAHRKVYGNYAIGFERKWGLKNGISPVMYVPKECNINGLCSKMIAGYYDVYPKLLELYDKTKKKQNADIDLSTISQLTGFYSNFLDLSFYIKPFIGSFEHGKYKNDNHKFYDEREWRFIPSRNITKNYVAKGEELEPDVDKFIESIRLLFEKNDITEILVPKAEIKELKTFIGGLKNMKGFDLKKIKPIEDYITKE